MVNQFLQVFMEQILKNTDQIPKGLMLHILDLYMVELALVGSAKVKPAMGSFLLFNFYLIFIMFGNIATRMNLHSIGVLY